MNIFLLVPSCLMAAMGACGNPLLMRLYFIYGGSRVWLSSWLQSVAWPIILIPLIIAYIYRLKIQGPDAKIIFMKPFLFSASAVIGCLMGLDNYLISSGISRLPASTSTLILSSQLAFTAGFAFLIVRQKFTPYSINSVFLLTVGAVLLALRASSDRPRGESSKDYIIGFVMTVGAAALYGFMLPSIELTYAKAKQTITYTLVLEIQIVISFFATIVCTVGMLINHDFQAISREAGAFQLGEAKYFLILVWTAILCQLFVLGLIGVIFCASSLVSGIVVAVSLPITEILAVIIYHESFHAEKIMSLILSLWGLVSYFYGEKKNSKKHENQIPNTETTVSRSPLMEMKTVSVAPE